jgi:uncharacterized membrane protein
MRPIFLALAALVLAAGPAAADMKVCNKTSKPAKVALGRFDGKQWTSQGWWTIAAKDCAKLISGPLDARFYYLYGTDGASGTWDGGNGFCTTASDKFSIAGRGSCAQHGYDRKGFFEVDTGNNLSWTQALQ